MLPHGSHVLCVQVMVQEWARDGLLLVRDNFLAFNMVLCV